jgi:RimJ/RimL family protein N-acetyltransferase
MQVDRLGPDGAYHTRLLTPEDLRDLQALFVRAADYFEIATGRPPAADEAPRAFVAGPPTKSVHDKRVIGIFSRAGDLVGVLDALTDWPAEGVWTLGMLLLDPAVRGAGLGTAVLAAYEGWARSEGARRFRTAVVAHHEPGLRFLERAAFQRENTLPDYDAGARRATVVFLTKEA